jgi:hypothetical protein
MLANGPLSAIVRASFTGDPDRLAAAGRKKFCNRLSKRFAVSDHVNPRLFCSKTRVDGDSSAAHESFRAS